MKHRKLIMLFFIGCILSSYAWSDDIDVDHEVDDQIYSDAGGRLTRGYAISGFGGFTYPDKGYTGYRSNPGIGGDLRLLFRDSKGVRFYTALAIEYFPLALPQHMVDFTEDVFTMHLYLAGNLLFHKRYIPYAGAGTGYYWHFLEQKVPHFGTKSDTQHFLGFNWHLGIECRITPYVSISSQYKNHYINQPKMYAVISVYSIHAIIYFGERLEL
ncbi:MAG: hypothetical protein ABII23_06900 [bacterium]